MLKTSLLEIHQISLIILGILLQIKTLSFFCSRFKTSINYLSIDFATLESFFSYFVFRKGTSTFLFLSAMSDKQESIIGENLNFTG